MIEVEALTKRYGKTTAVDDLSFSVVPGRVTGFLGPNGSGKSTTMRMIMGLDRPNGGRALVDGQHYQDLGRPLCEVGALLDGRAYHPGRSARAHLLALAQANAIPRSRVDAVLDQVGLTSLAGKRTGTFSLGMGQRLGIAAALLGDPGVVLLDEPVNGLDPEGIRWVRDLVRGLAAEGRTVLLSSHLISEMALTADQLVVIGQGRLVAELSVAELAAAAPRSVRVRTPDAAALAGAVREAGLQMAAGDDGSLSVSGAAAEPAMVGELAARAGIVLHELVAERASLEDIFMELTHDSVQYRAGGSSPAEPELITTGTRSPR